MYVENSEKLIHKQNISIIQELKNHSIHII